MAKKGFFKTLRSFSFAAALFAGTLGVALFGAVLSSCENLNGDMSSPNYAPSSGGANGGAVNAPGGQSAGASSGASIENCLTASVSLPGLPSLAGIAPVPQNVAQNISKSAFPNIADAADTAYSFEAELAIEGGATCTADGSYNGTTGNCSFSFAGAKSAEERTYTLTVKLYHTSGTPATKSLVASASQSVTVGAGEASFAASVQLAPNLESAPNGSLSLPIKFSDTSVSSVKLMLLNSAGTDVTTTYLDGLTGTTLNLTSGAGTIASKDGGLPAGTYTLLMTFMKGSAQVGARTESLNIYPTMQTKLWWTKDGIGTATTALNVTQFDQKEFWIRGTGGDFYTNVYTAAAEAEDTNNGSFAFPLKTIQEAVDRINTIGNTTTQYTIYIDGKVTVPADADYSTISDDYKKSLAYIDSAKKIAITGWTGSGVDIIDCGKKCRAITAASGAEVAITKLAIKNGDAVNYGGALYVGGGDSTVVLGDGALVNGNHCETNGGAIYCNGNLYICGSAVVGDYSPSMTVALEDDCGNSCDGSGGGISCSGNLYLGYSGKNSSGGLIEKALSGGIYRNYSKTYGGGIYSTGTVTMASGGVDFNAATSGGGVYVSGSSTSSGKFYMGGTSCISGNEATGAGGGVYNSESGIFCMAGSAIVGADPSGLTEAAKVDNGKHSNMAKYGGGIFIGKPSGFKFGYKNEAMSDPTFAGGVYYNYSTDGGGGIRVDCPTGTGQIFNFERGSVCYNSSGLVGGGITVLSVTSNPKIYITGGQVSNNSAGTDGGGIHAQNVYVGGGTIAGNTASNYGGGVYASQEFYLYGTGVIGDDGTHEVAEADDCSNKAKAGGGVYGHKVYIGYSDASTPAACTGGIYRNYATAVKGSETYFYGGGGICVRGTSAYWLFKMQSGTVAYNAGDSSDGYGGGLFIYGSGAPDSSIAYPEAIGGSFEGNGAKYGGAVCCYSRTLGLGGSIYMPSATGEKGDNDIYLKEGILRLLSNFDSATPTPVVTITPVSYTLNTPVLTGTALSAAQCGKFAVTQPSGVEFPWSIKYDSATGKGVLKQSRSIVYVAAESAGGSDSNDGTIDHPYATIQEAVKHFSDKTPSLGDTSDPGYPNFENKVYILSNMTFTDGAGADNNAYNFEIVACKDKTVGKNVTLTFNTESGSGLYVAYGQKVKLTNIDITQSSATPNNYAAILVENNDSGKGELWMEDCSIKNMIAKDCSAIAAKNDVHLKNVTVTGNTTKVELASATATVYGPAVYSDKGTIHIEGKIVVKDNTVDYTVTGSSVTGSKIQNVWIGENTGSSPEFHKLDITGALTGSDIGVTLYDNSKTFTSYFNSSGSSDPADFFTSDEGWNVVLDESGNAKLAPASNLYVSASGNDTTGNGTSAYPYATVQKAAEKTEAFNSATTEYTIHVAGTVKENASIADSGAGAKFVGAKLTIDGSGTEPGILNGEETHKIMTLSMSVPTEFKNLTFQNGKVTSDGGAALNLNGSAAYTITDCVFVGNSATNTTNGNGGAVYVGADASLFVGSSTSGSTSFTLNTAQNGGAIYNEGKCCIYGSTIIGYNGAEGHAEEATTMHSNSANYGGGIYNAGSLYLGYSSYTSESVNTATTLTGGVYYNYAVVGGGIFNDISSSVVVNSGNISKNGTSGTGGGGGLFNQGTLDIKGGSVDNNFGGKMGGGILVNAATTISGTAIISENSATDGAGVYIYQNKLTMNGGSVSSNIADQNGGGIYVRPGPDTDKGIFEFNSGTISENIALLGAGVADIGVMNMSGGTISQNQADGAAGAACGGGVLVNSVQTAPFTMTGGSIEGNSSEGSGGGLYIFNGECSISDGTISGNTAAAFGGGIFVDQGKITDGATITTYKGQLNLSGDATIPPGTEGKNDIALFNSLDGAYSENSIKVTGALSASNVAKIMPGIYGNGVKVLDGTAALVSASHSKFTVADYVDGGVTTKWAVGPTGYLNEVVAGGGSITIHTPEGDLNLAASPTSITTSASDTTVTISASDAAGTDITASADVVWNGVTVYYGVDEIDSKAGANTYKFKKTFPKGSYTLNVSVTYKGTTYSDSFTITKTVEGAVAVAMPDDFKKIAKGNFKRAESAGDTAYTITISKDFYMCDHEVTQKEWKDIMSVTQAELISDAGISNRGTGDNYPVYAVNWYQG